MKNIGILRNDTKVVTFSIDSAGDYVDIVEKDRKTKKTINITSIFPDQTEMYFRDYVRAGYKGFLNK
jgi:hypothetical protein